MQASAEISQKVRLAIKTKLTELGAYVDDELPDYVLVMVANRRGRDDMKKELELFLGEATERFCTWLFGVLDKLKDAKKGRGDKNESEDDREKASSSRKNGKPPQNAELDSYSEEEQEQEPKKEETTKPKKKEKTLSKTKSRSKSPKLRMDRSPALRMDRKQSPRRDLRRRGHSRSRTRSRSRDRRRKRSITPPRRRSRSMSRDRKEKSSKREKKSKKDKKDRSKRRSVSRSPVKDEKEKKVVENDEEKRSRLSKKIKAQGGLKSTLVLQKEPELVEAEKKEIESRKVRGEKEKPIKAVKPTSNLIIRAINDSAGTKNLSITRSITVKGGKDAIVTSEKKEKPGAKRKSKGGKEDEDGEVKQKKVKGTDQRVFITKNGNDNEEENKKGKKKKTKQRPQSPKFYVTLDGKAESKDANSATTAIPKGPKAGSHSPAAKSNPDDLIIHPSHTSDESDGESTTTKNIRRNINTTAQEEAAKIKKLQEQNPLPLIEIGSKQSNIDLAIDSDNPDARTIFVSGFDLRVAEKELKDHFEVCGTIVRVTVLRDRYTGVSKGCGYIQFETMEQRKSAINFDLTDINGIPIRVTEKKSKGLLQSSYSQSTIDDKPYGYGAPKDKYSFRRGGKSQYTWTRNGYMPPR